MDNNNKIIKIIKKSFFEEERMKELRILYLSDTNNNENGILNFLKENFTLEIADENFATTITTTRTTIKKVEKDILFIEANKELANSKDLTKMLNDICGDFKLIIIKLPKHFDFNYFIKNTLFKAVDVYKKFGNDYYFIALRDK